MHLYMPAPIKSLAVLLLKEPTMDFKQCDLTLTDQNIKEFENAVKKEMDNCIKHFERELITIRTGRAHPSLIEDIKVTCYGDTVMKCKELGSIATPEARLLVLTPWDKGVLGDIEKAIMASDLGVTPVNDGTIIRIQLPELTTERRSELTKVLGKKLEECRVGVRNVRKGFHNLIRDCEKNKKISEDHSRRLMDTLQKITDSFIKTAEQMADKKSADLSGAQRPFKV